MKKIETYQKHYNLRNIMAELVKEDNFLDKGRKKMGNLEKRSRSVKRGESIE